MKVVLSEVISIFQSTHPSSNLLYVKIMNLSDTICYEVDGFDDSNELKLRINATSGETSRSKSERMDREELAESRAHIINIDGLLSINEIISNAQSSFKNANVLNLEIQHEYGFTYWEVRMSNGSSTRVVDIDAHTGEVVPR